MSVWFGYFESSGGLPVATAAGQIPVSTGPGSTYAAQPASVVRSLILDAGRVVDPLTGVGWTETEVAPATWDWLAGPARGRLTVPAGAVAGVLQTRAGYLPDAEYKTVLARVQVVSGDGSASTRYSVAYGLDSSNHVGFSLWTNGTVELYRVVGGVFTSLGIVAGPSPAVRTGGQLWIGSLSSPHGACAVWGVGVAGAPPQQWETTTLDAAAATLTAGSGGWVAINGLTIGALGTDFVMDLLDFRLASQRAGSQ